VSQSTIARYRRRFLRGSFDPGTASQRVADSSAPAFADQPTLQGNRPAVILARMADEQSGQGSRSSMADKLQEKRAPDRAEAERRRRHASWRRDGCPGPRRFRVRGGGRRGGTISQAVSALGGIRCRGGQQQSL